MWFVLSLLGGLFCHYWMVCVVVFAWFGVTPEIISQQINSYQCSTNSRIRS